VASPVNFWGIGDPSHRVLEVRDLPSGQRRVHSVAHLTDASWQGFWGMQLGDDGRVYVAGPGGASRLTLPAEPGGVVSREILYAAGFGVGWPSPDGRRLVVLAGRGVAGQDPREELLIMDLPDASDRGSSRERPAASPPDGPARPLQRITTHGARLTVAALSPSGRTIVTGDLDGVVRVGPATGEEPHLLLGHKGMLMGIAISPDERWIATSSDESISIWPMPDVTEPPLHTLPHAELLAKLDALTNLRVARDASSSTGWALEIGPFPGWKDVPTW
jgi:WD40 repeat protein